jgi:hypothetical protein
MSERPQCLPCFVRQGHSLENVDNLTGELRLAALARNFLRYLTYGEKLSVSLIFKKDILHSLFIKPNNDLLKAVRVETQFVFLSVWDFVQNTALTEQLASRLHIFIHTFLSDFSFLKPNQDELLHLPVRINHIWQLHTYRISKIDISPKRGLLSAVLKKQNYLYAYGLAPIEPLKSQPFLLFMGTGFPAHESALLTYLNNVFPAHSIGEKHTFDAVGIWLMQHHNTIVIGHSLGGTMAMLAAAMFADTISKSIAFNPTALHKNTIRRLDSQWQLCRKKPIVEVYTQKDDPVFLIDSHLLSESKLFILSVKLTQKNWLTKCMDAHIQHFSGFAECDIEATPYHDLHLPSLPRSVLTTFKTCANYFLYPLCYMLIIIKNMF